MLITNLKKIGVGICAVTIVASCSISTTMDDVVEKNIEAASALREGAKAPTKIANQDLVKVNDDIWLGNTSKIEYEGEPLPSYLEANDGITLVSNRPISLYEIGDMLNKTTGLGIRYSYDLEADVRAKGESNKPSSLLPTGGEWASPDTMVVSYQGPLSGFLDEVSSRFGVWWKYDNKDIYFYRFITKTFVMYSLPTKPNMNVNIGGSASGSGGSSSISLTSSIDVEMWTQFEKTISSMIGSDAKLTVSPSDGTITLTATPNDIKLVAKYVNEQNARLARQVAISVKIMQVTISDSDSYGLDLKATFDDGVTSVGITGTQGITASDDLSNAISWGILKDNWSADAIMQAISKKNRTTLITSGTVTTLNNKPAPIQVTQKQNYISEMTKTNNGTDGDNYDISVTTEEIETGFTLDVLPRILEHGRMLVMFNMTLSDLISLEKVSFGNEDENQYIQNPKVESRAFTQEVALSSGESLILTGYEKTSDETNKTGTGSAESSLLGGNADASRERNILVIVLTPVVLETPLSPETRMTMN